MHSSKVHFNLSQKLLVQSEPGFLNDKTLSGKAKKVMAVLDRLKSGDTIEDSGLLEKTGFTPVTLTEALIELLDEGYVLKDTTRMKRAH